MIRLDVSQTHGYIYCILSRLNVRYQYILVVDYIMHNMFQQNYSLLQQDSLIDL